VRFIEAEGRSAALAYTYGAKTTETGAIPTNRDCLLCIAVELDCELGSGGRDCFDPGVEETLVFEFVRSKPIRRELFSAAQCAQIDKMKRINQWPWVFSLWPLRL
jgi:hypothetical protein